MRTRVKIRTAQKNVRIFTLVRIGGIRKGAIDLAAKLDQKTRTPDEIRSEIQGLSGAGWLRLRKVAQIHAGPKQLEPEDLLHEAFVRALDGRRKCPTNVDLIRFLAESMRSISDAEWQKRNAWRRIFPVENHGNEESAALDDFQELNPEKLILRDEEAIGEDDLYSLFPEDDEAQIILKGLMDGIMGENLRKLSGLGNTAYQSKRRLIRRRLDKFLSKGKRHERAPEKSA